MSEHKLSSDILASRPGGHTRTTSTPSANSLIQLLGGKSFGGVTYTTDEINAIRRLYGYTREPNEFVQTGSDISMLRHAQIDGARMLAVFARFVEPGDDPVKEMLRVLCDAGFDISDDANWIYDEEDE